MLYRRRVHVYRAFIYVVSSGALLWALSLVIPSFYYNLLLSLPAFLFGCYHLYEFFRLSDVKAVDLQPERIGLTFDDGVKWIDKALITKTSLYYSTMDKPMASTTLCLYAEGCGVVRIPGFPEIDKWIKEIY